MFNIPSNVSAETLNLIEDILRYTEEKVKSADTSKIEYVESVFNDIHFQLECEVTQNG